jgi:hypothetical protein
LASANDVARSEYPGVLIADIEDVKPAGFEGVLF